jgi:hypothetical protein
MNDKPRFTVEKDWITAAGLRAVVTMGSMGFRCGYVGVPEGHPLHGVGYDTAQYEDAQNIDVHGGLTFSDGDGKYPVESDLWFFGYDCGHLYDRRSDEYIADMMARYPEQPFIWGFDDEGTHRSLSYCASECESLAAQLARALPQGAPE